MYGFLAQVESAGPREWFDRFSSDEMFVILIIAIVFSSLLIATITWCVTSTVRSVLIAAANAKMADKLAQQGMPAEQIHHLVQANSRSGLFSCGGRAPRGWQKPRQPLERTYGKPV